VLRFVKRRQSSQGPALQLIAAEVQDQRERGTIIKLSISANRKSDNQSLNIEAHELTMMYCEENPYLDSLQNFDPLQGLQLVVPQAHPLHFKMPSSMRTGTLLD
jgi:hypothetical protein